MSIPSLRYLRLTLQFFNYFFVLAIPVFGYCENQSSKPSISSIITKEDQKIIKDLFYLLFSHGDFAYVIHDAKPMCSIDYTMYYARVISKNEKFTHETHLARKGFDLWKKYQHLFSMKKFKLFLGESDSDEHFYFMLINSNLCLEIIRKRIDLFQEYYGEKHSPEEFLDLMCQGRFFHSEKIDTTILGLLLGYPEEDVKSFCQRNIAEQVIWNLPYETPKKKFSFPMLTGKELANLKDKSNQISLVQLQEIRKELKPCSLSLTKNPIKPITTPYFMSKRDDQELFEIKNKYESTKQDIINFYYSEDFLEKILEKFNV